MKTPLSLIVFLALGARVAAADEIFSKDVAPFLKENCVRCHGAKKAKAKLMLHKVTAEIDASDAEVWKAVLVQLEKGEMPPEEEPRPSAVEIVRVSKWIHSQIEQLESSAPPTHYGRPEDGNRISHGQLFSSGLPTSERVAPATTSRIWRVRPSVYEKFVEHASRQDFHHKFMRQSFFSTPWGLEGEGFKDYSDLYWIGESETELLISNAMRVAGIMSRKRSKFHRESKVFAEFIRTKDEPGAADIDLVVREAFRQIMQREASAEEIVRYRDFMRENITKLGRKSGMETALAALLLDPDVVFRFELGAGEPDANGRLRLAPDELAFAIAYALTDEVPDEKLRAAAGGELATAGGVRAEVRRILGDESIEKPALLRFFREYFGYAKAPQVFKDLATKRKARLSGNYAPESLVKDTDLLVLHFVEKDKDVLRQLLTTDLSFVATGFGRFNGFQGMKERALKEGKEPPKHPFVDKRNRVNEHYNISFDQWTEDMPFALDKSQRAGILTQPSWLIAHSTNFENHAIHRGKWVLERLLGGSIPDTPITVDAQLPDDETLTLRERMRVTREAFCWQCHQKMDPLGLPFEMFDHFGRYRETELGKPVDATGAIPAVAGVESPGEVADAVARCCIGSAGRGMCSRCSCDTRSVFLWGATRRSPTRRRSRAADRAYSESGGSFKALVEELLASDSFLYRKPPPKPTGD